MSEENRSLKSPTSETDMRALHFEGFTIYRDMQTNGHWLPYGQLKLLAERQLEIELPPMLEIDEKTMQHCGKFCPEEDMEMVSYEFADSGITVEQCLSCKGVWLDAGELKSLMQYVFENTEEMTKDEYEEGKKSLSLSERLMMFLYRTTEHPPMI